MHPPWVNNPTGNLELSGALAASGFTMSQPDNSGVPPGAILQLLGLLEVVGLQVQSICQSLVYTQTCPFPFHLQVWEDFKGKMWGNGSHSRPITVMSLISTQRMGTSCCAILLFGDSV